MIFIFAPSVLSPGAQYYHLTKYTSRWSGPWLLSTWAGGVVRNYWVCEPVEWSVAIKHMSRRSATRQVHEPEECYTSSTWAGGATRQVHEPEECYASSTWARGVLPVKCMRMWTAPCHGRSAAKSSHSNFVVEMKKVGWKSASAIRSIGFAFRDRISDISAKNTSEIWMMDGRGFGTLRAE